MIEVERVVGKGRDCKHCNRTYGTLGCCSTVSNKWVYSCEEGHREYEETHKHMTIPEAIEVLAQDLPCETDEDLSEAIIMAIKALEQQPCEDWYDVPSNEMTLEQARQAVKDLRKKLAEYLEQKPCEDCISRHDALNCVTFNEVRYRMVEDIKALPSVTPKEKTAAWVGIDQEPHEVYECNACGWLLYEEDTKDFRFCPSCGARMQEVEGNG